MSRRRERAAALLLSLASAAAVLLIATSSSPLYVTNFWTDTNIYFTIGRGMTQGLMPYKDLFDHKGPVLFMLYAIGAMISDTSFIGVFVLEVLSLAAMLFIAYETVCLYGRGLLNYLVIPVSAMVTAACTAFNQGGCAEEFILPALSLALYAVLRRMEEGENCRSITCLYVLFGAAMGWVFAVKYTNCGLFFGLAFVVLCYEWRLRGFARAFVCGLWCLAGFAVIVLPSALYMLAYGALDDCLRVYFCENMFLYVGEPMTFGEHIYNALAYLRTQSMANPVVALLAMVGCAWLALRALLLHRKGFLLEAIAAPMGAGLLLLFTYWGEMAHPYYALVFAALAPLGLCPLGMLAARLKGRAWGIASLAALAACVPVCLNLCAAVPLMAVEREDMPQMKAAQVIANTPGATLLDWSSLDQGFYLAAGITPTQRYFANNNLDTVEKREAYKACIASGAVDYLILNAAQAEPGELYELAAEWSGVFDLNSLRTYRLYRLKGE